MAMFVSHAWEEEIFEIRPIIFLVFAYPDNAILDDVGHNIIDFCSYSCTFSRHTKVQTSLALVVWLNENVRLSTLIVWNFEKCYIGNEEIFKFLRRISKILLTLGHNN